MPNDGIHFHDVVVDPKNDENNNNKPTNQTTTSTDDHIMNAAEMGTAKHDQNTNYPATSNNTNIPIIIPLPPPTDVVMVTDNNANENVANHDPLDNPKTKHQLPDVSIAVEPMNDSKMNTATIDTNGVANMVTVEPVVGENDVIAPLQSSTRPVIPPLTNSSSNDNIQLQINELD